MEDTESERALHQLCWQLATTAEVKGVSVN